MKSIHVTFNNSQGQKLAGSLVLPVDKKPQYFAIFAHCFTCGKDLRAVRSISLALSQRGLGVLSFDFTGLGESEGSFADSNFSSNVSDIKAAADYLGENYEKPAMLIGHSLGGTAVLLAASHIESVQAMVTIGAPSEPEHVLRLLRKDMNVIRKEGRATVTLAGRDFNIKSQFIEDLETHSLPDILESMRGKALLVMHSPQDSIVEISNAKSIYEAAHHPKSFISLDGADHLLLNREDAAYAGEVISSWVKRYLPVQEKKQLKSEEQVLAYLDEGPFLTQILAGPHHLLADEPREAGGGNLGPTPYELLAAGLGACTAMTIKMYTDRKAWPLEEVKVHLNYDSSYLEDCERCEEEDRKIGKFERIVEVKGALDDRQKERILQIANKCPVHKTLVKGVSIETNLKEK